jgi:2-polyprenyl-3-methyl-5-hydroxy-6-metoxy-1,4-benzoquinol methylase
VARATERYISDEYLALNQQLHRAPRGFGASGRKHASEITAVAAVMGVNSILDYGCGLGTLKRALLEQGWVGEIAEYDPAVAGRDVLPTPADLVVCTDVLEHIEPDRLAAVLEHIRALTRRAAFLVIATQPAHKLLADGRNAHLIVESPEWWTARIFAYRWMLRSRFIRWNSEGIAEVSLWLRPIA